MINKVLAIMKLPRIKIKFVDDDKTGELNEIYHYFVKRHPKYKIFRNKTLGVMLYQLPKDVEEYEKKISGKNSVSYYTRRCKKMGYYTKYFIQGDYLDELYAINTSTTERQGRKMSQSYLEKPTKEEEKDCMAYIGVFNDKDLLVGYIKLVKTEHLYVIAKILDHRDYLNDNIMYLLMHDLTVDLIEKGKENDKEQYLMYDTYFGGTEGIKLFKKRNCFVPYRVKWIYESKKDNK